MDVPNILILIYVLMSITIGISVFILNEDPLLLKYVISIGFMILWPLLVWFAIVTVGAHALIELVAAMGGTKNNDMELYRDVFSLSCRKERKD